MTIIWINGTFGAGKTTTGGKLVELTEGTRLFDPEHVGYIDADPEGHDIRPWRHEHVDRYQSARSWLLPAADLVVDTTKHPATSAAEQIRDHVAGVVM